MWRFSLQAPSHLPPCFGVFVSWGKSRLWLPFYHPPRWLHLGTQRSPLLTRSQKCWTWERINAVGFILHELPGPCKAWCSLTPGIWRDHRRSCVFNHTAIQPSYFGYRTLLKPNEQLGGTSCWGSLFKHSQTAKAIATILVSGCPFTIHRVDFI